MNMEKIRRFATLWMTAHGRGVNLPFHGQVLHFTVLVLNQFEHTLHHLLFAVIVELNGVLLQLCHEIVGGHETKVLVHRPHLHVAGGQNSWYYEY